MRFSLLIKKQLMELTLKIHGIGIIMNTLLLIIIKLVLISNLYLLGGINFGSCVAGLCANAGIALAVLFRQNPNSKENIFIVGLLYALSSILGFVVCLF